MSKSSFIASIINDIRTIIGFYHFIPVFFLFFSIPIILSYIFYIINNQRKKKLYSQYSKVKFVTFIHPGCDDFGGGEKVLWEMIRTFLNLSRNDPYQNLNLNQPKGTYEEEAAKLNAQRELPKDKLVINIMTNKPINFTELNKRLYERFLLDLRRPHIVENKQSNQSGKLIKEYDINEEFLYLSNKYDLVLEVRTTPIVTSYLLRPFGFLTMFFQIIGQIVFAFEVIFKCYSDVFVDTTGLPFTYPILRIFGHAYVTTYTHYPFISELMIEQIKMDVSGVHSRGLMKNFVIFKYVKIIYYNIILYLYSFTGRFLSYAMVNSTWTYNHMKKIWPNLLESNSLEIVYPPCNIEVYGSNLGICRQDIIVSFGQFRPEKNHIIQVQIFQELSKRIYNQNLQLHIIGGVRNEEDKTIFEQVQKFIDSQGLQNRVKLIPNAPMKVVQDEFAMAKIGMHTMMDEHFGISIIEMMAAGLIVVAHNSGGAAFDIIKNNSTKVGRLASNPEQYVNELKSLLDNYEEFKEIGDNAKVKAREFSEEAFRDKVRDAMKSLLVIEN